MMGIAGTEIVEVVIRLCPKCRGSAGGTATATNITARARRERVIKAVRARERKRRKSRHRHGFMKPSSWDKQLGLASPQGSPTNQSDQTNNPSKNETGLDVNRYTRISPRGRGEVFFS
jgi:hypothetical protein